MRYLLTTVTTLGALAIPGPALANHGGVNENCDYARAKALRTEDLNPIAGQTLIVYTDTTGYPHGQLATAGACSDFNGTVVAGPVRFDGATVEAGVGQDPAGGPGDPELVAGQPDLWIVVDGDNGNVDPSGESDGYAGVSNWENSNDRTTQTECTTTGSWNGAPGSSNSGGCVAISNGPWVYVPGDVPTPICGNESGNAWDGSDPQGVHNEDGCSLP